MAERFPLPRPMGNSVRLVRPKIDSGSCPFSLLASRAKTESASRKRFHFFDKINGNNCKGGYKSEGSNIHDSEVGQIFIEQNRHSTPEVGRTPVNLLKMNYSKKGRCKNTF